MRIFSGDESYYFVSSPNCYCKFSETDDFYLQSFHCSILDLRKKLITKFINPLSPSRTVNFATLRILRSLAPRMWITQSERMHILPLNQFIFKCLTHNVNRNFKKLGMMHKSKHRPSYRKYRYD